MKKLAIMAAIAISSVTFGNVDAAAIGVDKVEIVEMGAWTNFRDSITGRREREKERQAREDYARERYEQDRREQEARERYEKERREQEARERYARERDRRDGFPSSLDRYRD